MMPLPSVVMTRLGSRELLTTPPPCLTGGGGVLLELLLVLGTGLGAALASRGFRPRRSAGDPTEPVEPSDVREGAPASADGGAGS